MTERDRQAKNQTEQNEEQVELQPSRLARKEIVPVTSNDRDIRWLSFTAIWFTMTAQMGIFALGASLAKAMPTAEVLLATLVGNMVILFILVLIGDIGIEHGINFAGYLRVPFGLRGSYLPLALRGLAGVAWFGIQTYLGATAIEEVSTQYFDVSAMPVWYISFGILQIAIVAAGLKTIKKVVNFAAPALALLSGWLLYIMFSEGSIEQFLNNPVENPEPFIIGVVSSLSYWSTVAINLPDFTRNVVAKKTDSFFSRNRHSWIAQLIGVPIGMLFFTTVGMAGYVFSGESNPVLAISATVGGTFLLLALGVVVLAQLSTNVTANLFASAYAANAIGSPKISYRIGAIITGIMGLLTFPWVLLEFFLTYLPAIGAALAPIAGIMIADYYLIRKRRINVKAIFEPEGQYLYWHSINPASYLSWLLGALAGVIWLDYSFIIALPISLVLYYLLMRYWILDRYEQKEVGGTGNKFLATSAGHDWPISMRKEQ
jgi:NCS1 family nucleobase:cation symporter-1